MIAMTAVLAASTGCGVHECSPGASRCHDDQQYYCVERGDVFPTEEWQAASCGVACVELAASAQCVDAATPIVECARGGGACWGDRITTCVDGFPTDTTPCDEGTRCVATASVRCWHGYVVSTFDCGSGRCLVDGDPAGWCTAGSIREG